MDRRIKLGAAVDNNCNDIDTECIATAHNRDDAAVIRYRVSANLCIQADIKIGTITSKENRICINTVCCGSKLATWVRSILTSEPSRKEPVTVTDFVWATLFKHEVSKAAIGEAITPTFEKSDVALFNSTNVKITFSVPHFYIEIRTIHRAVTEICIV